MLLYQSQNSVLQLKKQSYPSTGILYDVEQKQPPEGWRAFDLAICARHVLKLVTAMYCVKSSPPNLAVP